MTGEEYTRKKQMLAAYEALERNRAYVEELLPLFQHLFRDALAGLRNRSAPREKRDEYLEAADQAERLLGFVSGRIGALEDELSQAAAALTQLEHEE